MASLPPRLSGLLDPRAYPHPVREIRLVQTHISWVLLTGDFAYKLKRPVRLPFVDQSDAARRLDLCREELRLNARFAPRLYLDVCPVVWRDGRACLGGAGEVIDHAVRMAQFPPRAQLDVLLAAGRVMPRELADFGAALARIHAALPRVPAEASWGTAEAVRDTLTANLMQLAQVAAPRHGDAWVAPLRAHLDAWLDRLAPWITARRAAGHVRECHGDLHCANVMRRDGELQAFDCLEFEPAFRWIDVAQEIAFLMADLAARNAPAQALAFLAGYLAAGGDYAACRGLPLFTAHCALVRAKVAALMEGEGAAPTPTFDDYLDVARRALQPSAPLLVAMHGLSGSGKSWLARELAPRLGAVVLQSDVERKRLAGLAPTVRSGSGIASGLYALQNTAALYAHLLEAADALLEGGVPVIIDATFATRERRGSLRELAARRGTRAVVVACHAPIAELERRIADRTLQGADASEADLQVLRWQQRHAEPVDAAAEGLACVDAQTMPPPTVADLDALAGRVRGVLSAPRPS